MTSSQAIIYGFIQGSYILLAFFLIAVFWNLLKLRPQQANKLWSTPWRRFHPPQLFSRFSDIAQAANRPPAESEQPEPKHPAPVSRPALKWRWLGLTILAFAIMASCEAIMLSQLKADENNNILFPLIGTIIAGFLFAYTNRQMTIHTKPFPFTAILPTKPAPSLSLWLSNVALTFVVISSVDNEFPNGINYLLFGLWIFNIILFCWNVSQLQHVSLPTRDEVRNWWRAHRLEILLLALIGLAAFLIRWISLETYPYSFINDEGEVGWEGLNIIGGQKSNFFITGWAGQLMMVFLPTAISIKMLGISGVAVRIIGALQGTISVVALYLLAREAFGRPVAFFSACLLSALPWHVHFSRLGVMNIADSYFSAVAMWLTYRALRRGKFIDYLPAGLITGLTIYSYVGSRLVIAMAVGVLGYAIITQRTYLRTHLRHLAIFLLAFFVVAGPGLYSAYKNRDEFMGRFNEEGLLAGNHLQERANGAGTTPEKYIQRQIQISTSVFYANGGVGQFFDTPEPYIVWWAVIFLFLGMFYIFWNFKQVRYIMLIGWFWAPVILGGALTSAPPSHQRMLAAAPAAMVIIAIGLWKFAQSIQISTTIPKKYLMVVCILFTMLTVAHDIHFYFFGEYRTDHHFEIEGNEFSYEVAVKAASLGPTYRLLLIGDPEVYSPFASFHFFTNTKMDIQDFNEVKPENIAAIPRDRGIFFACIPTRVSELELVQQQIPGGTWVEVSRHTQPGILYYGYIVEPPKP